MKTFNLLKSYMQDLGIFQRSPNRSGKIFNLFLNCVYFGISIIFSITTFWYFSFTAQTLTEYSKCFYFMTFSLVMLVWYPTFLWKRDQYATLFVDFNAIVKRSKCKIESYFNR